MTGNDGSIRRTALTAYGIYNLPFGRNQQFLNNVNGFVNQLVSGFQVSPVVIIQSGLPFTLSFNGCGAEIPGDAPCYVNGPSSALKTQASASLAVPVVSSSTSPRHSVVCSLILVWVTSATEGVTTLGGRISTMSIYRL